MKSWTVIPAMGGVCAAAAIGVIRDPFAIAAAGALGAALAAAVRALAGNAPASLVAAVLAPLLAVASLAEHEALAVVPCLALAAVAWTIVELARATSSPLVAMLPATLAGVLEPAAIALVPIAGTRLVTAPPWQRPRPPEARGDRRRAQVRGRNTMVVVPIVGGLAIMLAVIAGSAQSGAFATLGLHWFGTAPQTFVGGGGPAALAHAVADALGPLTAVAALVGLALLARLRLAEVAALACAAGGLLVDLRAGVVGSTTLGIAALCAALAIGRFAQTIRMPSLQAVAGGTVATLLLVPPAWTVIEHGILR